MPSVRDIAKTAGVSVGTVSRVLNNKPHVSDTARMKVMQAANRVRGDQPVDPLGHRVVRGAVRGAVRGGTTAVALVYHGASSLDSAFDAALLHGIAEGLNATPHDLMVVNAARGRAAGESLGQMLMRRGVVGALLRTTDESRAVVAELATEGFPAVALADHFEHPGIGGVVVDARPAIERALEHLAHLGHRRLAIALNIVDDHDHAQRLAAFRGFVAGHGLPFDDRWIVRSAARPEGGGAALRQLMALPDRPTAVFATDPQIGVGICVEALRMGIKLPDELSLIGFDDASDRFGTFPRMSSVCQDAVALGMEGLRQLLLRIDRRSDTVGRVEVPGWFEPLDSTAPPPA